jgi:hypothetical protein
LEKEILAGKELLGKRVILLCKKGFSCQNPAKFTGNLFIM